MQVKAVAKMILNNTDGFRFNNKTLDNDFVIIKLQSPFHFNEDVQPACLPPSSTYLNPSSTEEFCFTSGWGVTETGLSPDLCHYAQVPTIKDSDCSKKYENDTLSITDSMICAGSSGRDACQGDSGGPLVCNYGSSAVLTGVVSWGDGCGQPEFPGVYSRVTHVLDWILQNMVRINSY